MAGALSDPDVGYVRLALAILVQAIQDACASGITWQPGAYPPTVEDAQSAREFLVSPAATWLAARLGLSLERMRGLVNDILSAEAAESVWLDIRTAAQCLGCHPEHVRRLVRSGKVAAQRGPTGRWRVHLGALIAYRGSSRRNAAKKPRIPRTA
ncbi:MAG: helix-turn-helix domain-containing protein [Anaerolineae bacterium]